MKKIVLVSLLGFGATAYGQLVNDSVSMGAGYTNNVWYSLENDEQGTQDASNWDLAFATTISPSNELATSILFNPKVGSLYEIPGSDPANFATTDTTGLSGWTPLFNSDLTWSKGALNNTTSLGSMDYGWGTYDAVNHTGINANRIFALKFTSGDCIIFHVSLSFSTSEYTITYADADHSNSGTEAVAFTSYASKNFIYYAFGGGLIDREPASADWDIVFTQFPSSDYNPPYVVTGILQNVGVEVAEVHPVSDPETDGSFASATYSEEINTIGYDWKTYNGSYVIADSLVYYIKDQSGTYWRFVLTGFSGSAAGKTNFKKEKITALSVDENKLLITGLYPNPANQEVTILVDSKLDAAVQLVDMTGKVVYETTTNGLNALVVSTGLLQNGTYLVRVSNEAGVAVQRVIIQH